MDFVAWVVMVILVVRTALGDARRFGVRPLRRLPADQLLPPPTAAPAKGRP